MPTDFWRVYSITWSTAVPLVHGFTFHGLNYPQATGVWEQMVLLTHGQVYSSLTLRHNAYVIYLTSSRHIGILASHIITRKR